MVMFMVQAVITTNMADHILFQQWDEWFPFNPKMNEKVQCLLRNRSFDGLSPSELIKTHYLIQHYDSSLGAPLLMEHLLKPELYQNISQTEFFVTMSLLDLVSEKRAVIEEFLFKNNPEWFEFFKSSLRSSALNNEQMRSLLSYNLEPDEGFVGRYSEGVKLFLILSKERTVPGLFILKDHANRWVRNENGELWSQLALASSKHDLPFYSANGQTPQGIMTIDAVMPEANNQTLFGKNRRLVINFVPHSKDHETLKSFLPIDHQVSDWWKQSVIARDIGRRYFRIHGTGLKCQDEHKSYYPFVRTSGCIAQREVEGKFNDQRVLLNQLMKAMDLEPIMENETLIKGVLTVVESNHQDRAISLKDIELLIDSFE